MRLLFIENRYKTWFYEAIVPFLIEDGHEVFWLVQNPFFEPKIGKVKKIPFPPRSSVFDKTPIIDLDKIIRSDRQQNFFGNKSSHYFTYYALAIERVIKDINPEVVFGESTAFHELIAIEICKTLEIQYLNPSTCRYPTGRFSFYHYDSLDPYGGSGEVMPDDEAMYIIQGIVKKESKPDYMKKTTFSKRKEWKDMLLKTASYIRGEKYNTPHPFTKYRLEKNKKQNIIQWEAHALPTIQEDSRIAVLYPLQMQPEANLDVWGRKWRDQTRLVEEIANRLPTNAVLYVKPNPKSKYELSHKLVLLCQDHPKIIHLSHKLGMEAVFPKMDMVITVTGTIAIECILANKPILTLANTLNNSSANCVYLQNLDSIPKEIERVKSNTFPTISDSDKITFINRLNQSSFKGQVNDPYTAPISIEKKNRDNILFAMRTILESISSSQT